MKISIIVRPNSRTEGVSRSDDGTYVVRVGAPPVDGKANKRVIALLAEHFDVQKRRITITRGDSSRKKVIEIA